MRVGVKILDDAKFRNALDEGFGQLAYALANSDVDEALYRAHYSHLTPQGRGRAYLLKFSRPSDGDWNSATLLEASTNQPLGKSDLDLSIFSSGRQEEESEVDRAHFLWVEQILAMCVAVIKTDQRSS